MVVGDRGRLLAWRDEREINHQLCNESEVGAAIITERRQCNGDDGRKCDKKGQPDHDLWEDVESLKVS